MAKVVLLLVVILVWYSLPRSSSTTPPTSPAVCAGSRAPVTLREALGFCGRTGMSCCGNAEDAALREQLHNMNISDAACAGIVKAILCSRCIPSGSTTKSIPPRCASPPWSSRFSAQHDDALPARLPPGQDDAMCLENISSGSYLSMVAHPDGSGRVFLATQDGKIWLASVPAHGSGGTLQVYGSPFLDLTDPVRFDTTLFLGLMGVAFHPGFNTNGRFFVSYTCNSSAAGGCSPAASGSCSTRSQYQLIVAEFTAEGADDYSEAPRADPSEVRRIFTMGLPQMNTSNQKHGGQILFPPSDGFLYLITGHGGDGANHFNFSNDNSSSFLGKIIRFDVDGMPGNNPEIIAMGGLMDPRGCSFDSDRPSFMYCADIEEQQYQQVHLISNKAENYSASLGKDVTLIISHGRLPAGMVPSIVGGLMYRGSTDPMLKGRYLYLYGSTAWTAVEAVDGSRQYVSTRIPSIRCSRTTPVPCNSGGAISVGVLSMAGDNSKDAFILASDGVYRVVAPDLCNALPSESPAPQPKSGLAAVLSVLGSALALVICLIWWKFKPEGQPAINCNICSHNKCCIFVFFGRGG